MDRVRLGFVGAGGIARHHLAQLHPMPDVEITAISDLDPGRAEEAARSVGARPYSDPIRMLDEVELDALFLCIPPFAHGAVDLAAVRRGLALFVEKPVALSLDMADEIAEAIDRAGVITSVGYVLRYFPGTLEAERLLEGREIALVSAHRWGGIPDTPWWRAMDRSGGQLVEMTTHQVDLMRRLAGEVVEVSSRSDFRLLRDVPGMTIPDAQAVLLQFASGAIGCLTTSCALTAGGGRNDLEFVCRDCVIRWTGDRATVTPERDAISQPPTEPPLTIDRAFIQAILTGDRSLIRCDYSDGLKTLDVTLCANRSAAEGGRPIRTRAAI